jgi:hypothetical protein
MAMKERKKTKRPNAIQAQLEQLKLVTDVDLKVVTLYCRGVLEHRAKRGPSSAPATNAGYGAFQIARAGVVLCACARRVRVLTR